MENRDLKWTPSKELFSEMKSKGFWFEIDKVDGEPKAYIEAPPGYCFKGNGTHCDAAIWGDEELKRAISDIEHCDCEDCESFWKTFQGLRRRVEEFDIKATEILGKLLNCQDEEFADNILRWNQYEVHYFQDLIADFVSPKNEKDWLECPKCGMKPKVWIFDNGRYAACGGCRRNKYDHFQIRAESIMSWLLNHNGSLVGFPDDELRENWNKYCRGELESMFTPVKDDTGKVIRW